MNVLAKYTMLAKKVVFPRYTRKVHLCNRLPAFLIKMKCHCNVFSLEMLLCKTKHKRSLGANQRCSGVRCDCCIQDLKALVLNWWYTLKAASYSIPRKL